MRTRNGIPESELISTQTQQVITGALTVRAAVAKTGINKTRIYALAQEGKLDLRKAGRQTLVTEASIAAYLTNLPPAKLRDPAPPRKLQATAPHPNPPGKPRAIRRGVERSAGSRLPRSEPVSAT